MIGIYKITFPNGHYYYGQALSINRRFAQHKREFKKGIHSNKRLQNCYNKYGEPVFEVVEECEKDKLNITESKYLFEHIDNELCCNMCREGRSPKGIKRSKEFNDKISRYQRLNGKCKPVYMFSRDNMDMLAKFDTIRNAEKAIGANPKDVQKSCKSNGKYNVRGYKFMYAQPIDNLLSHLKSIVPLN